MKTRLFLMAMASVALASCVSEDVSDVKQKDEKVKIAFESPMTMMNAESRAKYHGEIGSQTVGSATYTYPLEEEFIIFAVQHDGDFPGWDDATIAEFDGQTIKRDASLDGWAPKTHDDKYYYWPNGKMSFAACSPAEMEQADGWETSNIHYDGTGLTLTDFVVPDNPEKHIDLMFSKRTINKTKADMLQSADNYSGIPIQFQHALSSIHFSLSNTSGEIVVLKGITISGIYNKGTFKENIDEEKAQDGTFDYTDYVRVSENGEGNVTPQWTVTTNSIKDYTAFSTADGEGVTFPVNAQYVANLLADTELNNTGTNHSLLLLPQDIPATATLTVDYTVNGSQSTKTVKLADAIDETDKTTKINKWEIGTKYTYRLVYSKESANLDRIYFSPGSDSWIPAGIAIIDLK